MEAVRNGRIRLCQKCETYKTPLNLIMRLKGAVSSTFDVSYFTIDNSKRKTLFERLRDNLIWAIKTKMETDSALYMDWI